MRHRGWTQMEVAAHFGVGQSTVNRWLTGSEPRGLSRDSLNAFYEQMVDDADASGDSDIDSVPLVGYVGAGATAHFYGDAQGEIERVRAPKNATPSTVAVEVRGESLGPLFQQWLVFYDEVRSPVTPDMYGRMCIVGLPNDQVLVKQVRPSKTAGLYHLLSNTEPPILDQEIAWAAIVRSLEPRG